MITKGEAVQLEENYLATARKILAGILEEIQTKPRRYTIAIAGESGSGKTVTAKALAHELEKLDIPTLILYQDDYYIYPPLENDRRRREDPTWRADKEVHLAWIDANLQSAQMGEATIEKPVMREQNTEKKEVNLAGIRVVIAEGTYTLLLDHADQHIFIDRSYLDTREGRQQRLLAQGRDLSEIDAFTENEVLPIEHQFMQTHRNRADILITRDYNVEFIKRQRD